MREHRGQKAGLAGCVLATLAIGWAGLDSFDNVLYNDWLRENIHWFTPILPVVLLVAAAARNEKRLPMVITGIVVLCHYGLLWTLYEIGRAGASLWEWL